VENDPQAHDRTCVSKALSGNSVPRRLNARPQRCDRPEATPPRTGCPSCTLLRPAGRHAMVVAHFFESGSDAVYWADRERTANGRRSSAGQHRVHSCDRRKGLAGTSARPASGFPTGEPALPTETARGQSTRGASRVILLEGAGSQPSCARRTGCSPANGTLRSLDDWLVPACYQCFTAPFYYDLRNVRQKSWGAYASNVIRTY